MRLIPIYSYSLDSAHVLIITGERKYLELIVLVDSDVAPLLTVGREKIEDILVLHLEGGKDFFVSLLCQCQNLYHNLNVTA